MTMDGPTPTPERRCSKERGELQQLLAWTYTCLRDPLWVADTNKETAPYALKVEASPCGPPRRTFLARGGGIAGMARPDRRARLRTTSFLLAEFCRRSQRPDGDRAWVTHQ